MTCFNIVTAFSDIYAPFSEQCEASWLLESDSCRANSSCPGQALTLLEALGWSELVHSIFRERLWQVCSHCGGIASQEDSLLSIITLLSSWLGQERNDSSFPAGAVLIIASKLPAGVDLEAAIDFWAIQRVLCRDRVWRVADWCESQVRTEDDLWLVRKSFRFPANQEEQRDSFIDEVSRSVVQYVKDGGDELLVGITRRGALEGEGANSGSALLDTRVFNRRYICRRCGQEGVTFFSLGQALRSFALSYRKRERADRLKLCSLKLDRVSRSSELFSVNELLAELELEPTSSISMTSSQLARGAKTLNALSLGDLSLAFPYCSLTPVERYLVRLFRLFSSLEAKSGAVRIEIGDLAVFTEELELRIQELASTVSLGEERSGCKSRQMKPVLSNTRDVRLESVEMHGWQEWLQRQSGRVIGVILPVGVSLVELLTGVSSWKVHQFGRLFPGEAPFQVLGLGTLFADCFAESSLGYDSVVDRRRYFHELVTSVESLHRSSGVDNGLAKDSLVRGLAISELLSLSAESVLALGKWPHPIQLRLELMVELGLGKVGLSDIDSIAPDNLSLFELAKVGLVAAGDKDCFAFANLGVGLNKGMFKQVEDLFRRWVNEGATILLAGSPLIRSEVIDSILELKCNRS